jgi:thioredoxin-related protein
VNGLQEEWGEQVRVLQVNVNHKESRSLVEEFGGQFTPTFVLFDAAGQEVWRATGRLDPAEARLQADALLRQISEVRW